MQAATYYETIDVAALRARFPVGPGFDAQFGGMSRDELRARQNAMFLRAVARAWKIPFYQRLWGGAGVSHADIGSIDDIGRLPAFGKDEVMASLARNPPFGDHHGRDLPVDGRPCFASASRAGKAHGDHLRGFPRSSRGDLPVCRCIL